MSSGYYQIFLGRSVKLPLLENLPYVIDKQGGPETSWGFPLWKRKNILGWILQMKNLPRKRAVSSEGGVFPEASKLDCGASENQWGTLKERGIEWEAGTMSLTPWGSPSSMPSLWAYRRGQCSPIGKTNSGPLDSSMGTLGDKIESELAELVPEMEEKERPQAVTSDGVAGYY